MKIPYKNVKVGDVFDYVNTSNTQSIRRYIQYRKRTSDCGIKGKESVVCIGGNDTNPEEGFKTWFLPYNMVDVVGNVKNMADSNKETVNI